MTITTRIKELTRLAVLNTLGPVTYEHLMMWKNLGYWPHLRNPRSMNEHIGHLKVFATPANAPVLADKYLVRQYVESKGLGHILNPVYHVGTTPEEIPFDELPEKFVIRFTHSSGGTIFVGDKSTTNRNDIIRRCHIQLKRRFGRLTNENWYSNMTPRLMVEKLMEDETYGIPPDYKFYFVNGRLGMASATHDRHTDHMQIRYYTPEWKPLGFGWNYPVGAVTPPPSNLEEMKTIAAKLAEGLDFVRIDLYSINDKEIRFGEITFADDAGWGPIEPREYDFKIGRLWNGQKLMEAA